MYVLDAGLRQHDGWCGPCPLVFQPHVLRMVRTILIGLQSSGAYAVRSERFVLLLRVAGDAYRAR